ncbi:MAG: hypothetical protein J0H67_23585 [Rhodospirillales bacterium]|nr:hypothetical protein [Rhodospirillales bacterium]
MTAHPPRVAAPRRPTVACRPHAAAVPVAVAATLLLLSGCTGRGQQFPTVVLDTPQGAFPLYAPNPAVRGDLPPPPSGMGTPPPTGAALPGTYAGFAEPLQTGGGRCLTTMRVHDFKVRDGQVHYDGFDGPIYGNGAVQIAYGMDWLTGQFTPEGFRGQMFVPGRLGEDACTFQLVLQRVGP